MVQIYLRMDRLDLAQSAVKALKAIVDEDHVLFSLSTAWTHVYVVSYPSIATPSLC
jgi:hypothetical protein